MKPFFASFLSMAISLSVFSQDNPPAFGNVSKAELTSTECTFNKDAEAVCLVDEGENSYTISRLSVSINGSYRKRIKVLKEPGVGMAADVKIKYYSKDGYENITGITGTVYNLDDAGNIVASKLEKAQIYDKKIDSRWSEISFALPNVKIGSVVEYKYKRFKKSSIEDIDDWYFQSYMPVKYSSYNLILPEYFDFTYNVTRRQDIDIKKTGTNNGGIKFTMRDIPALKDEPFMSGMREYLQRVNFQLTAIKPPGEQPISYRTTWKKLSEELMDAEWFGRQLSKNVKDAGIVKKNLANVTEPAQKIKKIYEYVQSNMTWDGNYSRGSYEGISTAWDKKSGNITDINLILTNLLQDNGIKAAPLLVSTRDNGVVNTIYPFLEQFNATYVYAEAGDKTYILNAADKYNPYSIYPYDVQLTDAFLVRDKNPSFFYINDDKTKLEHKTFLFIGINGDGKINGNATIESKGYAKNIRKKMHTDGKLKDAYGSTDAIDFYIDSINVSNADLDDAPLRQEVYFTGKLRPSGDYYFLPYNLFLGLNTNPFIAEKRESAIDFGYNQTFHVIGSINIDSNYVIEDMPKNIRMILPDTSVMFTRILQKNNQTISFQIKVDFMRQRYEADEYPDVKELYKKLFAMLTENIAIKKKN